MKIDNVVVIVIKHDLLIFLSFFNTKSLFFEKQIFFKLDVLYHNDSMQVIALTKKNIFGEHKH